MAQTENAENPSADAHQSDLPHEFLTTENLARLESPSTWRGVNALVSNWLMYLGFVALYLAVGGGLWATLLAVPIVGSIQHRLVVLGHEAAHFKLTRNRTLNNVLGETFIGFAFPLSLLSYRAEHRDHHEYLMTSQDPGVVDHKARNLEFPKSRAGVFSDLVSTFFGVGSVKTAAQVIFGSQDRRAGTRPRGLMNVSRPWILARLAVWMAGAAAIVAIEVATDLPVIWWVIALWVLPMVTWLQVCLRVRLITEHHATDDAVAPFRYTRTVRADPLSTFVFYPHGIGYHLEHHLYANVPWFRLRDLESDLNEDAYYATNVRVVRGIREVLRQMTVNPNRFAPETARWGRA